ncbi:restriction endonuclease [Dictyobacter formicarum]|uniref:Restriction endonuclease type IV Mrr domain-containing protein n=1 Tax=Dictyobacter formicarum TaxID=2778368 RepID=A0ABQ3VS91_9CHLR|nr:restriction endonuclease [Dictyobacter formicarum]GHO88196.1 hypothetical protein KSZ_62020 [Dictyobacter formicarum]
MNHKEIDEDSKIERKVLGHFLFNPEYILSLKDHLRPEDFSLEAHQTIYRAVLSFAEKGRIYDFIDVCDELVRHRKLDEIGGASYIVSLLQENNPEEDMIQYVQTFGRSARLRHKKDAGQAYAHTLYSQTALASLETRQQIARLSPSFRIFEKILDQQGAPLDRLHWREFEELIADLLEKDGYQVKLGCGTKDGGQDIIAMKELEGVGSFMSVWQAKKLVPEKKVGLSVIRELADTRTQHKASKGIIVTSTYLTRGALERVSQDQFILGKVDRDDLMKWVRRIKRR